MLKLAVSVFIFTIAFLSIDQLTLAFFGFSDVSAIGVLALRTGMALSVFAWYCSALLTENQTMDAYLPATALIGSVVLMLGVMDEIQMLSSIAYTDVVSVMLLSATVYTAIFCAIVATGIGFSYHLNPKAKMIDPDVREYYNTHGHSIQSTAAILSAFVIVPALGTLCIAFFTHTPVSIIGGLGAVTAGCLVAAAARCVQYSAHCADVSRVGVSAVHVFDYSFSKKETKLIACIVFIAAALYIARRTDDKVLSTAFFLSCAAVVFSIVSVHRLVVNYIATKDL